MQLQNEVERIRNTPSQVVQPRPVNVQTAARSGPLRKLKVGNTKQACTQRGAHRQRFRRVSRRVQHDVELLNLGRQIRQRSALRDVGHVMRIKKRH